MRPFWGDVSRSLYEYHFSIIYENLDITTGNARQNLQEGRGSY